MRRLWMTAPLLFLLAACGESPHPADYEQPAIHSVDVKLQTDDCRTCHGDDLAGGSSGLSCDSCHPVGWREDCTFCHGGDETDGGAPPRGLDGSDDLFGVHTAHASESNHAPYDCVQCHVKPTDVLSTGHTFDDTPGVAEVDFSGGQSPGASWDGNGTCSEAYCHGSFAGQGTVSVTDDVQCGSCHPAADASAQESQALGGEHREHIAHDVACADCHPVVNEQGDLVQVTEHANGEPTLELPDGITRDNGRCTGNCHNENHDNDSW